MAKTLLGPPRLGADLRGFRIAKFVAAEDGAISRRRAGLMTTRRSRNAACAATSVSPAWLAEAYVVTSLKKVEFQFEEQRHGAQAGGPALGTGLERTTRFLREEIGGCRASVQAGLRGRRMVLLLRPPSCGSRSLRQPRSRARCLDMVREASFETSSRTFVVERSYPRQPVVTPPNVPTTPPARKTRRDHYEVVMALPGRWLAEAAGGASRVLARGSVISLSRFFCHGAWVYATHFGATPPGTGRRGRGGGWLGSRGVVVGPGEAADAAEGRRSRSSVRIRHRSARRGRGKQHFGAGRLSQG